MTFTMKTLVSFYIALNLEVLSALQINTVFFNSSGS